VQRHNVVTVVNLDSLDASG